MDHGRSTINTRLTRPISRVSHLRSGLSFACCHQGSAVRLAFTMSVNDHKVNQFSTFSALSGPAFSHGQLYVLYCLWSICRAGFRCTARQTRTNHQSDQGIPATDRRPSLAVFSLHPATLYSYYATIPGMAPPGHGCVTTLPYLLLAPTTTKDMLALSQPPRDHEEMWR